MIPLHSAAESVAHDSAGVLCRLTLASVTPDDIQHGYGSMVFMGCFIIAAMFVLIWWLRRG